MTIQPRQATTDDKQATNGIVNEARHHLAVVPFALALAALAVAALAVAALLASRQSSASSRSCREELVELVLLSLVAADLDGPPRRVHEEVETAVRMPGLLAVHVSHRGGQAGELLETTHQRAVEVRLRGLRLEPNHEGVP